MKIDNPIKNVFIRRPVYRGSDWLCEFAMDSIDDQTGISSEVDLSGYTVRMHVFLPGNLVNSLIKDFVPEGNRFSLSISSEETYTLLPIDEPRSLYIPIEVYLYNSDERLLLIRDRLEVIPTSGGGFSD